MGWLKFFPVYTTKPGNYNIVNNETHLECAPNDWKSSDPSCKTSKEKTRELGEPKYKEDNQRTFGQRNKLEYRKKMNNE